MGKENIRNIQAQELTVIASTNPFGVGNSKIMIAQGLTLKGILEQTCPDLINYKPIIFIDDYFIDEKYYHVIRPKPGCLISVNIAPLGKGGGGKNPLRTVLSIALLIAAPAISGALLGGGIIASTAFGAALISTGVTVAVTVVGSLLINSLCPIASTAKGTSSTNSIADVSQTYYIQGAKNSLKPYSTVPELLGTHRIVPPLCTQTYTEVSGDIVYVRQMFALTNGKLAVSEEKFGDTLITEYEEVEEEDFFDGNSDDESKLIPSSVTQNDLNITITPYDTWVTRTTATSTDEIGVQLSFASGLIHYTTSGDKKTAYIKYEIRYALTGTSGWTTSSYTESRSTTAGFVISKRFKNLSREQYDVSVRITEVGYDNSVMSLSEYENDVGEGRHRSEITWSALRSFKNENPVNTDNVSLKAIRVKGTDQLSGAIDNYNLLGSRKIPDWNGSAWIDDQETSNPASILRYVLLSETAKTTLTTNNINEDSIVEFWEWCDEKGFTCDIYIDYDADRENILSQICACGIAALTIIDNKYTLIIDKPKTTICQHISQRNSYDYQYTKTFSEIPHAFRVSFLNKDADYNSDEILVYDDGYNSTNATRFESIDFPGVVSADNNYKLARQRLAELRLRPDMHQVTMDIENIVATRGDRVRFSHDIALIGMYTGRIKTTIIDGSNITGVVVDEEITMESGGTYSFEFRTGAGNFLTVGVTTVIGTHTTLNFSTPISSSTGLAAGALFSFGITDSVTIDALVYSVVPQSDFTAEVKLINYNEAIYEASEGTIPTYDANITIPAEFNRPLKPVLLSVLTDEAVQIRNIDGSISSRMVISLINNNAISVTPIVLIKEQSETEYSIANTVQKDDTRVVIEGLEQGNIYTIKILYKRVSGAEIRGNSISSPLYINNVTFVGEGNPPSDVNNFDITVRGETVYLTWDAVTVIDLDHYEIRFSQEIDGASWQNGLVLDNNISRTSTSTTAPSAIGTYMIKAVDKTGNCSENATLAVTTVGKLLSLNVVQEIDESAGWGGTFEGTRVDSGTLKLGGADTIDDWTLIDDIPLWDIGESGIVSIGYYYFADTFDLGDVYDNVLSALLSIEGENVVDKINEWDSIDGRDNWDSVNPDQYSVSLQVRTTDDNPDSTPTWTAWKPLRPLGEYTARAFEFRLVLTALVSDITPVVSEVIVKIDMPDRIEDSNNISSGIGGKTITFSEAFRVAPTVAITADNMQTGDYPSITNVTGRGFDIEFFDSTDTSVDITFSYVAKGYGRIS